MLLKYYDLNSLNMQMLKKNSLVVLFLLFSIFVLAQQPNDRLNLNRLNEKIQIFTINVIIRVKILSYKSSESFL